ncbi:alpha/beta hydrolase [Corynebacterium pygosceleis]|uniref:Alpha/beta hydrolase n=1 Tax=Corynebacterium pygosceleis TaxID=2800406 RepID=A0A9Q4GHV7_9CORY|nr:alpha/beta hydrolase [Corynebacterium pygosceleis]MCK7636788.1 alpha/beta hydrolase [Corynebacterium pygosceleis]MCK7674262.1 alpha/beta hydrolase [Corynebacterium pygosceleis]MCL0120440.1 alpha/beta hydrolase [Corynebacterium pygosceleis]MCX7443987.1 alpha/beta hydrolase [Corynebacterium pygosceleis]MCX7467541.1 alpha/beta hydrolase [Corynebacterium pygosceleis]
MSDLPISDSYTADILGEGFTRRTLRLGEDPEGDGPVVATLVRYLPDRCPDHGDRTAMIFVHGMSDYFFHRHVAERFHDEGYAVYGVDLRKCGRSHLAGQLWHDIRDLRRYFDDLDSVLDAVREEHGTCVIQAHSTGGLIAPLWLDHLRRSALAGDATAAARHSAIAAAVLNSPWLDLMFPSPLDRWSRPLIRALGARRPELDLPGGLAAYGHSIHAGHHGEWEFDTRMKPIAGHAKNVGWLAAVVRGQDVIQAGGVECGVPVLVLCSTQSWLNKPYSAITDTSDAVLDVHQIRRWAPSLGAGVTVLPVEGARHDVWLSLRRPRERAFTGTVDWLNDTLADRG